MRGRKPNPSAINEVKGNPGKRARKKAEPKPEEGVPECPDHLNDAARMEWFRIVPELSAVGLLTRVDRAALAGYCVAYARWQEAEKAIPETGGLVVLAPTSGYPMQNPYLSIANAALKEVRAFLGEFGMSPSSRTRVATNEKPKAADPTDEFFTGPRAVA